MHAPVILPLLRRVVRGLACALFQLALVVAYLLRFVGALLGRPHVALSK